ncbi:MAG TPA: zinc-ribbon domain-containing protein [Tepidisphaeraceae bacterium]|jgi:tetratricopeptide (TPR) repeat protein|nr:zinc-ribbon domain-containing protein [Tepidisphaeraceae bacterium]
MPRNRPRGFILFFGTKPVISAEPGEPLRTHCPRCGQEADFHPKSYRTWFTLFFIPLFPVGAKRPISECGNCRAQFPVALSEMRTDLAAVDSRQSQAAITLFNGLHKSPANSVALNELMSLHASMKEYDAAIAAAGQFPQALDASEHCMTMLGRVYLAKGRPTDAIQWFDAAIDRNDSLADAYYHKAVAHLATVPPDPRAAITAARAARAAGHPGAETVLRDAEAMMR